MSKYDPTNQNLSYIASLIGFLYCYMTLFPLLPLYRGGSDILAKVDKSLLVHASCMHLSAIYSVPNLIWYP